MTQKRRHPKSRTRGRRGRWVGPAPTLVACPQCKTLILPHRVCPSCGHYAGREVVAAETPRAKKKKER